MIKYSVRPVVCDCGVYENDKLIVVCERYSNALLIADILNLDLQNKSFCDLFDSICDKNNCSKNERNEKT